ncbi:MAG: anti-sigma regulatory factor [Chloroflexi bacterium]|nr:anti-sigma regulatory factor [Chloroflexota bacterium]
MYKSQTIPVHTEFDVFTARMQAREMAREIGFDAANQARVAMATTSLARALRLGEARQGQVTLNCLGNVDHWGMRVDCTTANSAGCKTESWAFTDIEWMVDRLVVKELPSNNLQVTLFALMPRII